MGNNWYGLLWLWWLFSCACMCSLPKSGWWVWVRVWVGHKSFLASGHTVGFTFNTV